MNAPWFLFSFPPIMLLAKRDKTKRILKLFWTNAKGMVRTKLSRSRGESSVGLRAFARRGEIKRGNTTLVDESQQNEKKATAYLISLTSLAPHQAKG